MHPTLRQVPPSVPRFSMHVTWEYRQLDEARLLMRAAYLHAILTSFDGGNVAGNATTDDNQILLLCSELADSDGRSRAPPT